MNTMPPDFLDGARVIKWIWSGKKPFGFIANKNDENDLEEVYGIAICKYDDGEHIYRFSCNKNWEVIQDSFYNTTESAVKQLPEQYKNIKADWQSK